MPFWCKNAAVFQDYCVAALERYGQCSRPKLSSKHLLNISSFILTPLRPNSPSNNVIWFSPNKCLSNEIFFIHSLKENKWVSLEWVTKVCLKVVFINPSNGPTSVSFEWNAQSCPLNGSCMFLWKGPNVSFKWTSKVYPSTGTHMYAPQVHHYMSFEGAINHVLKFIKDGNAAY